MVSFLLLAPYGLISNWLHCMAYVYNIALSVFSLIYTIPLACSVQRYINGVANTTNIPQWNQYLMFTAVFTLLLNQLEIAVSSLICPSLSLRVWFTRKLLVYLFSKRTERNSKHLSTPWFYVLVPCCVAISIQFNVNISPALLRADLMVSMCMATVLHFTVLALTEAGLERPSAQWGDTLSHCFYFYF